MKCTYLDYGSNPKNCVSMDIIESRLPLPLAHCHCVLMKIIYKIFHYSIAMNVNRLFVRLMVW